MKDLETARRLETRPYITLTVKANNLRQACDAAVREHKLYAIRAEQVKGDLCVVDVRNIENEADDKTFAWFNESSSKDCLPGVGYPIGTLLLYNHHDPNAVCPQCGAPTTFTRTSPLKYDNKEEGVK